MDGSEVSTVLISVGSEMTSDIDSGRWVGEFVVSGSGNAETVSTSCCSSRISEGIASNTE